ncbi:MAG TPA: NADH-quinone oxidoreductase subunit NuoG [Pyrinomonadaceae bacterium]
MVSIFIDNQPYTVNAGQNLLQACLSLGFDLPYFCWHPALGSVGACRQCAIKQFKDENDTRGKIVMACMTPAIEATRISINDPEAHHFRASVIEWLMMNHPHDCPVCDEGGECHLQDMTVMTGHTYREFRFPKRTFTNQDLGPFINHEMNRCIECYRCVRFYRDYAGGRDFDVFAAHDHVYFGRHEDGTLESEFSGNLVEVCPTGVFTDKTLKKHYTRKWDLQTAPSVCVHCALGCNTIAGERYGTLRRIRNRFNHEVNGYFLCDRGRYGYEFVNSEKRIRESFIRIKRGSQLEPISQHSAIEKLKEILAKGSAVIGIGSPRASLEDNFALRTLVGPENFFQGVSERETRLASLVLKILQHGPARSPSLHDVQLADAVLVLGEDVTNVAPILALALRQSVRRQTLKIAERLHIPEWDDAAVRVAVQQERGPLFIASTGSTKLDDIAMETYHGAPDDLARLGFAVAQALSSDAPKIADLSDELTALATRIAAALKVAERPLVISGVSCGSEALIKSAANVASALCTGNHSADLCFNVPECNSFGLALLGGDSIQAAFERLANDASSVIVLENDLYRRADSASVDAALDATKYIVAIDHLENATTRKADLMLPAATFAESDGTFVNNEGRAQRFYQALAPQDNVHEAWRWLRDTIRATGRGDAESWTNLDDVDLALASELAVFEPILRIAPTANFRIVGQKIPRQPHRYSGRTAMLAQLRVHEPKPPDDPDSPLSFSMEGYEGRPPSSLIPRFWSPGWNSIQSLNKFQSEVGESLQGGDPGQRLFEPAHPRFTFFDEVPRAFQRLIDEWLIVPLYHIFGSEELSLLSPAIQEQAPTLYIALNANDAARLGVNDGEQVKLDLMGSTYSLPVKGRPEIPEGVAGLPVGMRELQFVDLPAWARLARI